MNSPFSENITIIVNKRAIKVIGLIKGEKTLSNQCSPFNLISPKWVRIPAKKGMPK